MSVASTASNFVNERRQGLTERSYLAGRILSIRSLNLSFQSIEFFLLIVKGVKTLEILLSQLFVFSVLMLIQVVIIMVLLFGFLKVTFSQADLTIDLYRKKVYFF
jgi:hypothetical protein